MQMISATVHSTVFKVCESSEVKFKSGHRAPKLTSADGLGDGADCFRLSLPCFTMLLKLLG